MNRTKDNGATLLLVSFYTLILVPNKLIRIMGTKGNHTRMMIMKGA